MSRGCERNLSLQNANTTFSSEHKQCESFQWFYLSVNVGRTPRMYIYINVVKSLNHNLFSYAFFDSEFHTLHFLEKRKYVYHTSTQCCKNEGYKEEGLMLNKNTF